MGVDLWNYQAPDGSSLRAAVEFLIPFATGESLFPFQKPPAGGTALPAELLPVLRLAGFVANDTRYQSLAQQVGATPSLELTLP